MGAEGEVTAHTGVVVKQDYENITPQFVQPAVSVTPGQKHYQSISSLNSVMQVTCAYCEEKLQDHTLDSPFGIEQVTDLLIVDLHVGHLNLKSMALILLSVDPLKQRAAESRD